jgi:ribonuclease R
MNSHARLTYTKVGDLLQGDDEALGEGNQALVPHIKELHLMYKALKTARLERGAIEFETKEPKFIFNSQRKIESIVALTRNDAHKLIEECMILANVSAARLLEKHEMPSLYRVHDEPDPEKLLNFSQFLGELGVQVAMPQSPTPKEVGELFDRLAKRPEIELIQTMLLRSMKQAVYQADNIGHFGLALNAYAHFTSPIRRYPDLVVHRGIKAILKQQGQVTSGEYAYIQDEVDQLGEQCSMTERRADDATREVADWLKCEFMQDHVGDVFNGVISSVTNFGLFVRLHDLYIDGMVHVTSLGDDFYHYDGAKHCLVGERSRKVFRMGDIIEVQVSSVSLDDRRINLGLANNTGQDRYARRRAKKASDNTGSVREQLKAGHIPDKGAKAKKKPKPNDDAGQVDKKRKSTKKSATKSKTNTTGSKKKRPGKNSRKRAKS